MNPSKNINQKYGEIIIFHAKQLMRMLSLISSESPFRMKTQLRWNQNSKKKFKNFEK